jgi:hypothetical protein
MEEVPVSETQSLTAHINNWLASRDDLLPPWHPAHKLTAEGLEAWHEEYGEYTLVPPPCCPDERQLGPYTVEIGGPLGDALWWLHGFLSFRWVPWWTWRLRRRLTGTR